MLIDFHCHTKATKTGERSSRNIPSIEFFCDQIKNAGVKMVAITNHNVFDYEQFREMQKVAGNSFVVLPGIEIDIIGISGEQGHVVFFYDDNEVERFNKKIGELLGGRDADSFAIGIDEFVSFANELSSGIIMAHYHKSDALDYKSLNKIKDGLKNNFRFFFEPSNYRTLGIMVNNNFRVLMGSDVQDWSEYSQQQFASLKLDIDSYNMLFRFIKKDDEVVESVLSKLKFEEIPISYSKDKKTKVRFYQNVNIIFGEKGSGKTQALNEVRQYFEKLDNSISYYSPQSASRHMDDKLSISQSERRGSSYGIDTREDEIEFLNSWEATKITKFDDYIEHVKTASLNANKVKMRVLSVTDENFSANSSVLKETKSHLGMIGNLKTIIRKISPDVYLDKTELSAFNNAVEILHKKVLQKHKKDFSEVFGMTLAKHFVNSMKDIADKNTDSKSLPGTTGFTSYAKILFKTKVAAENILNVEDISIVETPEFVGNLDNGKKLYRQKKVQGLSSDSKAADGFEQITYLRQIRNALISIKKRIFDEELENCIVKYKDSVSDLGNFSIDSMLGVSKCFTLEDGEKYTPSTGEETMIILDETLRKESDIYILDEPEKSLGNSYINDTIVSRINDLAKRKKTLVIVTHNANIAIRTLPYQTILKYYDGDYRTYVGNLYSGALTNLSDGSKKGWREESIRILEGGREAFNERGDIYDE